MRVIHEDSPEWIGRDEWEEDNILIHRDHREGRIWEDRGGIFIHHWTREDDDDEANEKDTDTEKEQIEIRQIDRDHRIIEDRRMGESWVEQLPVGNDNYDMEDGQREGLDDHIAIDWKVNRLMRDMEETYSNHKSQGRIGEEKKVRFNDNETITDRKEEEEKELKERQKEHQKGTAIHLKNEPMMENPNSYRNTNFSSNRYSRLQEGSETDTEEEDELHEVRATGKQTREMRREPRSTVI